MPRIDTAAREVAASPERVYDAFIAPEALRAWLPPEGMRGEFSRFDARPGGSYRMVLHYADPAASPGKHGDGSDVMEARFAELVPGERVVLEVDFDSDDPAFQGTMRMTWSVVPTAAGSRVEIRAEDVPPGVTAAEHAVGLASSLAQLAAWLER
ncbi:SRPBCC domain-containing protein [Leucobacter allii]|uniref:SRPBCC domain-containing protein n=1 Tax=Leucobacter allii TaxID=2932247 RepID=UPI001FD1D601|nr:SRPBCC domain-containing protein [Leucobacter allii]UOR00631.1 SRPBCC domain-containing protein [Leucobacter allii]